LGGKKALDKEGEGIRFDVSQLAVYVTLFMPCVEHDAALHIGLNL
jgi:hypothetical protein